MDEKVILILMRFWDQYYPGGEYTPKFKQNIQPSKPKTSIGMKSIKTTGSRDLVDEYQKVASLLTTQVQELKATIDQVEKEREFYFGKLREIELYIQQQGSDVPGFKEIQNIMYKVFLCLQDGRRL
jgi:RP/EB family microtubule-associated protein